MYLLWFFRCPAAAPDKADADIGDVIAAVGVVVDISKTTEEKLVAVAEIQKRLIVEKYFQAGVGTGNATGVAIVIDKADTTTDIGNEAAELKIVVDERCGCRGPEIAGIIDKVIIDSLSQSQFPTWSEKIAVE